MKRIVTFFILLLIIATVVFYINDRIENYDMRFYTSKDNGILAIIRSNILLSSIFFLIMTKQNHGNDKI